MPVDLDEDALAWSEQQAELLRRLARGERAARPAPSLRTPTAARRPPDVGALIAKLAAAS